MVAFMFLVLFFVLLYSCIDFSMIPWPVPDFPILVKAKEHVVNDNYTGLWHRVVVTDVCVL